MTETRPKPVNMDANVLADVIADIHERIPAGDSFEGHIEWMLPEDDNAPPRSFDVTAMYRVGNTMGQGSMRMIGTWEEVPDAPVTFTATRDQLVDAVACIRSDAIRPVNGVSTINAESLADAIIEGLTAPKPLVHYRWPPQCFSEIARNETWTGDLDRVTCPTCRNAGEGADR
jgi:hypothetical protein